MLNSDFEHILVCLHLHELSLQILYLGLCFNTSIFFNWRIEVNTIVIRLHLSVLDVLEVLLVVKLSTIRVMLIVKAPSIVHKSASDNLIDVIFVCLTWEQVDRELLNSISRIVDKPSLFMLMLS